MPSRGGRRCIAALLCSVLLPASVAMAQDAAKNASATPKNNAARSLHAIIAAREDAVWRAAKDRDVEQFKRLVAEDALMIFTSGVRTRAEYLASMPSRRIVSYELRDVKVTSPAPNVAVTTYLATIAGVFEGREVPPFTVREASVWLRRAGKWVAVLNQETPIK